MDDYRPQVATLILDRNGAPLDAVYRQHRMVIDFKEMGPLLPQAFVAAEDSRYWQHGGLDIWSIMRAAVNNLRSGRKSQGGSTITQQVTRSLMLSREKTYFRKITEAILAYRLDRMLTKEEILAIYLNEIYLGEGAYGVEAASRVYFNKRARQLNLAEIGVLAGLPQAPSKYSPLKHPSAAKARQRYVLNRMAEEGSISNAEARRAYKQQLHYQPRGSDSAINGYFAHYVKKLLMKQFGEEVLFRQGLRVTTTLDRRLQKAAAAAVRDGVRRVARRQPGKNPPQGAMVVLETATGRVRAMIGGSDYTKSQYNRATLANRQPGSVFKPLIYAAALEKGISPDLQINDAPLTIRNPNGTVWQPRNYSNNYPGPTPLAEALIQSSNIVAIKLLQQTGVRPVLKLADQAGISTPLKPELPLALGASPVSVLEMTAAYTIFANQGMFHLPVAITRVRNHRGRIQPWPQAPARQVIRAETAHRIKTILTQVLTRGTGTAAAGITNGAGKTGTSDANIDAWFVGFTPKITAGVWLGHDKGKSLGKGETGGRCAAPVWKQFMLKANR